MTHRPTTVISNVTITQFITVIANIAETPCMRSTAKSACWLIIVFGRGRTLIQIKGR